MFRKKFLLQTLNFKTKFMTYQRATELKRTPDYKLPPLRTPGPFPLLRDLKVILCSAKPQGFLVPESLRQEQPCCFTQELGGEAQWTQRH